ncbi:MAG: ATP-binding protein [Eubacteriales bacterium]|nr:ATP-binding protein [Eubacteriales bacterium]MDD4391009.1 ATP-binding protein [Eubacteriales bacterium]
MTRKIFISIIAVATVVFGAALMLIMGVLHGYYYDQYTAQLKNDAIYISEGMKISGEAYLESISRDSNNRITLLDEKGDVLYDSEVDASTLQNHRERQEINEAIILSEGTSERYSETLSVKTFYYAMLLDDGNILRVSNSTYTTTTLIKNILQPLIFVVLLAIILSLFLAFRLAKRIVMPINMIDLENPGSQNEYEELAPLLARISVQNRQIRKQIEELNRKRQEFSVITENMNEGLIVINNMTNILSCNQSAADILGISEPQTDRSIFVLNRSEPFRNAAEGALAGERSENELVLNSRTYHIIANPVMRKGKIEGAVIFLLDVTEKNERDNFRREFTANVSHELKTPLTSISGYAQIIKDGIAKEEDIVPFAGKIYNEAARLVSLINDIIKLSQMDEGLIKEEQVYVDLRDIAKAVAERLAGEAANRNIDITVDGESATIRGIHYMIDEMIFNIVDNAIKYNREGGSITIKVFDGPASIVVEDTGVGIPVAERERIFERFYRVDKSHSKDIGGTGLGLSIVKHFAAYHNADIKLESQENQGTTVTLTF